MTPRKRRKSPPVEANTRRLKWRQVHNALVSAGLEGPNEKGVGFLREAKVWAIRMQRADVRAETNMGMTFNRAINTLIEEHDSHDQDSWVKSIAVACEMCRTELARRAANNAQTQGRLKLSKAQYKNLARDIVDKAIADVFKGITKMP